MTIGRLAQVTAAAALATAGLATGCGAEDDAPPCAPGSGIICTVAGTGVAGDGVDGLPPLKTRLYSPRGAVVSPAGDLFVVDWNNHRIRAVQPNGTMRIVAGVGELGLDSDDPETKRLNHPTGITFDADGRLVIAAWHNSTIKRVDVGTGELIDTCGTGRRGFAGDGGPALTAVLDLPVDVAFDPAGDLIIADQANQRLRKVATATGIITTIAGKGPCPTGGGTPVPGAPCFGGDGGPALEARFNFPRSQAALPAGRIAIDGAGAIYIADTGNQRVRKIDPAGIVTTFAGSGVRGRAGDGGPATAAELARPTDVAVGPDGRIFIADTDNSCIRVVDLDGVISTAAGLCGQPGFAGDGGTATNAKLDRPDGVSVSPDGNLYVSDTYNHRIRVVYP